MGKRSIEQKIKFLRQKIQRADYLYYTISDPEIADKEYDQLLNELKALEETYPQFLTKDSPTQRVSGKPLKSFSAVEHKTKMLSLDNTYSLEDLGKWEERIKRIVKFQKDISYVAELKVDGVSCSLTYKQGFLILGLTRGDGETGEDVTLNIKTIKTIPLRVNSSGLPFEFVVRGEIYIEKDDFRKINKQREERGEAAFVNPRNAASGSLKLLNSSLVAKRGLKCLIHSFGWADRYNFRTHQEFLGLLSKWQMPASLHAKVCKNLDEVKEYCTYWVKHRNSLSYEADGVVVKVNDFSLQEKMGSTSKSPRWAVAYKFPADRATTRINKIEFGVGRTGIITPVAILKPVECGGVTISRATLHNFDEIKRLGLKQGDMVLIERAGEVIPKIVKVIHSKRTGVEKTIEVPIYCPVCGAKVSNDRAEDSNLMDNSRSAGVYLYCLNPDCPSQIKRALIHFTSRGAMDIEGLGESAVGALVDEKIVKSVADIYKLTEDDLLKLPLFKKKKASKIISAILQSKKRSLSNFIYGLGIRHVGEKVAFILAEQFKEINKFFYLSEDELTDISEIGQVIACSVLDFFSLSSTKKIINNMQESGVDIYYKQTGTKKNSVQGKSFVFTGELNVYTRRQAQDLIKEFGGKCVNTISRKTDFLVEGKNPGTKYAQAKNLGVMIINEAEFIALLNG